MDTKDTMLRIQALKEVMAAETFDNTWFAHAGALVALSPAQLERPGWDKGLWQAKWGEIETLSQDGVEVVVWHRNDGGPSMADKNDVPNSVKLAKFALLAELALAFKALGQLTYVSVGYPEDKWRSAVIYVDGKMVNEVVEADSLMGNVRVMAREKGKLKIINGEAQHKILTGAVRIDIHKEQQAFF
jgi:hypothetical protein